jgi:hypothetical protein
MIRASQLTPKASVTSRNAANFHSHTYAKYGGHVILAMAGIDPARGRRRLRLRDGHASELRSTQCEPGMLAWQAFDAKASHLLRGQYRRH